MSSAVNVSFKPARVTPGINMALSAISDEFNSTVTVIGVFRINGFGAVFLIKFLTAR